MRGRWILIVSLSAGISVGYGQTSAPTLSNTDLRVGDRTIRVEIASTSAELARGLMFRKSLAANAGMLFIFPPDRPNVCMWMKNTTIPLSAAFLDKTGAVLKIADMQPQSERIHCADGVRFVLEVNQGIFTAAGVKPGARIRGLPLLPD